VITATFINRVDYVMPVQQIQAVGAVQENGGEQSRERDFQRIFDNAKAAERKKAQAAMRGKAKNRFSSLPVGYGKHAAELGFAELPTFDMWR